MGCSWTYNLATFMSLQPGSLIGPYEIVSPLGRGGMGEVYRARDTRLNRDVAIKVLPASVAADHERLARFTREAQTLAALNHPNIAAIYGVEVYDNASRAPLDGARGAMSGSRMALIMELVEGEDLSKVIARGPMSPSDALPIARQIAEALETAHDLGIVHRDLKPANIKVRADGTVKVLDFGLAKALGVDAAGATTNPSDSPTLTSPATMMGMVLGTAAYMAPEQARGRAVDRRADIWSFGVVLFEMLTGRRLFDGDDVSVTLAGVLKDEPDWSRLPVSTPAALHQLLRRTLVKDPKQRLQSIGEARILIDGLMSGSVPMVPASAAGGRQPQASMVPWAAAAAAIVALGVTLVMWAPWRAPWALNAGPVRVAITMPSELRVRNYRILPNGTALVLRAWARKEEGAGLLVNRLYLRPLDAYAASPIPGTDGAVIFWVSPDSRWLGVLVDATGDQSDRRLMKVPVDGSSPPVLLAHWGLRGSESAVWLEGGDLLTWVPDGKGQALLRIPGGGGGPGKPIPLKTPDGMYLRSIGRPLPGDAAVFAQVDSFGPRGYQTNVWLLDPQTGALSRLIDDAAEAVYLESGHVVFTRGNTVHATAFDLQRLTVSGDVKALETGLATVAGPANLELSASGSLAYEPTRANQYERSLVLVDAGGRVTPFIPQTGAFVLQPSLHQDGTRAVVTILNPSGTYELWMADTARASLRRLVTLPSADAANAIWSPDRQSVAYVREGFSEGDGIYIHRVDGTVEPWRLLGGFKDGFYVPTSWLPDGSGLIVTRASGAARDVLLVPVAKDGAAVQPRPLRATTHEDDDGAVSPDGRLIAFSSNESGRKEMYVATFNNGTVGHPIVVSDGVCGRAEWAGPRRLVYCATPGVLKSVEITTTGPALSSSTPVMLHDLRKLRISNSAWTLRADGRVFGLQRSEAEDSLESINVVLGWAEDVKRRLAGSKR